MSALRLEPFPLQAITICLIAIALRLRSSIVHSILNVAPRFFRLALYLLSCSFNLGLSIACPLTNLALRAPRNIVYGTLHCVLVHFHLSI